MKKIFKKLKLRDIVFTFLGLILGGSIGITATTYVLQSSEIQYDSNKSVQQAIDELYTLAENAERSIETLPIGDVTVSGYKITVPYTGSYQNIKCVYGTTESYGNEGTISNNTCYFKGTNSNQKLYYKIVATNITNSAEGKLYEYSGSSITGTCDNFDDDNNCITKTTYTTGDAIKLGGYNWHVISDTGTNLTLLMDANQLGSYRFMLHCSEDNNSSNNCTYNGSYYVYSWNKSKIRTYLNGTFLTDLQSKITNEIVESEICADPSKYNSTTYGGYLMSELTYLGKTSSCTTKVTDKVRLISPSEYYNMSPYYTEASSSYPNVGNYITKISISSDYSSWLYCKSISCGNSSGVWWTMGSNLGSSADRVMYAHTVNMNGELGIYQGRGYSNAVRPVITIVK